MTRGATRVHASSFSHLPTSAATSRFVVRVRMQHGQVEEVGRHVRRGARETLRAPARGRGRGSARPTSIRAASRRGGAPRHSASALTIHLRAFGQRRLDLGERHPARRAHGEARRGRPPCRSCGGARGSGGSRRSRRRARLRGSARRARGARVGRRRPRRGAGAAVAAGRVARHARHAEPRDLAFDPALDFLRSAPAGPCPRARSARRSSS